MPMSSRSCFRDWLSVLCTPEDLDTIRGEQERRKLRTGYYGTFARCRSLTPEEALEKIRQGQAYVVRLRSPGSEEHRIRFDDMIKGSIEMPENDQDIVLLKSDGIPTYHFAHVVDDHLMRTTHVIRGDEWISSVPIHLQLFKMLGFKPPKYAHVSPLMKEDAGGKRKLSKRKGRRPLCISMPNRAILRIASWNTS